MVRAISEELLAKLDTLPGRTGVYLMKDARGSVIYVGKAVNLRSRVRSYFQTSADHGPRTRRLVEDVADLEWIVTDTELEALILENELIKRHQPRYNVRLKDDKNYPYIKIHWQDDFPKVSIVRRMAHDGARYYGPFTSSQAVRQTLDALRRVFPYLDCDRKITGEDERPCLYFHIKRCAGPCIGAISREEYRSIIQGLCDFLEGKTERVLADLQAKMQQAADEWQFERAALYRDQIRAAEQIVERQKVVSGRDEDEDVIAFAYDPRQDEACVQVFLVRHGRLIGRETFVLDGVAAEENGELLSAFLKQFYDEAAYVPPRILLPQELDERQIIEQWLRSKRGAQVMLKVPRRGAKRQLVEMALENARETLQALQAQWQADTHRQTQALTELQEYLHLPSPPLRIECFDISTLQGTNTVGSMVVFAKGVPLKSDYRRFNVRSVGQAGQPDDYAAMREVLRRRFRRAVEAAENPDPGQKARRQDAVWSLLPDLVIVDGGKGQLNVALEVLDEYGLREVVPVVGLAKQHEEIFLPGQPDPVVLPRGSEALHLMQRIRDEAHRFAITHQRARRQKSALVSILDEIPGIGPRRRQALLKRFGSLEAIRQASLEELAAVPGMTRAAAERLKASL
ncbi:MAG: excinuclease ABC subunit UvrC [Anaerolineae bacterium]|nr:excinuclease ABC subunit UvrC [Anaerolineae bacterium]MDW8099458.1 excinuclease ABC subunit UvrC [Anaerolineae bacterium]